MIALVTGGFAPLHIGHLRMLEAAQAFGRVVVGLNSDAWLERKRGRPVPKGLQWDDRRQLLEANKYVSIVLHFDDSDGTVCDLLERLRPDFFLNGGDRKSANEKEHAVCERIGIREVFGVGGDKLRSSSEICGIR